MLIFFYVDCEPLRELQLVSKENKNTDTEYYMCVIYI